MFPLIEELRNVLVQLVKTLKAIENLCDVLEGKITNGTRITIE